MRVCRFLYIVEPMEMAGKQVVHTDITYTIFKPTESLKDNVAANSNKTSSSTNKGHRKLVEDIQSKRSSHYMRNYHRESSDDDDLVEDIAVKKKLPVKETKRSKQYKIVEIRNIKEYEAFKNNNERGVILYGAAWCKACKDIEDLYRRIGNRYQKYVTLAHCDIDVAKLEFSAVPVFVGLYKGKQIDSIRGADKAGLKQLVKQVIEIDRVIHRSQSKGGKSKGRVEEREQEEEEEETEETQ